MDALAPLPHEDPFRPPEIPTLVACQRCRCEYESYLIEWRQWREEDGLVCGGWFCPTPGCRGVGFGMDLQRLDPDFLSTDPQPAGRAGPEESGFQDWPGDFLNGEEDEDFAI